MVYSQYQCMICSEKVEIPSYVATIFPEYDIICNKCNKLMKNEKDIKKDYTKETSNDMHPSDPRPDIKEDAMLWLELLNRLWSSKKELYYTFRGFRCAGSKLRLNNGKIEFTFSEEFDNIFIENIRKKYLLPNKDILQIIMNKLSKDMISNESLKDCPV